MQRAEIGSAESNSCACSNELWYSSLCSEKWPLVVLTVVSVQRAALNCADNSFQS